MSDLFVSPAQNAIGLLPCPPSFLCPPAPSSPSPSPLHSSSLPLPILFDGITYNTIYCLFFSLKQCWTHMRPAAAHLSTAFLSKLSPLPLTISLTALAYPTLKPSALACATSFTSSLSFSSFSSSSSSMLKRLQSSHSFLLLNNGRLQIFPLLPIMFPNAGTTIITTTTSTTTPTTNTFTTTTTCYTITVS